VEIETFTKLIDVGVTVAIMGVAVIYLAKRNTKLEQDKLDLIDKAHTKDLTNIQTLEMISRTLEGLKNDKTDVNEIKSHVSDKIQSIREEIQRNQCKA